ncbi:hypothetical protein GGF46_002159 [Coemansia sp. RSA 552]|nr:hypothetical protein GGF46_002159 [Coemansia sp. RSA 552]
MYPSPALFPTPQHTGMGFPASLPMPGAHDYAPPTGTYPYDTSAQRRRRRQSLSYPPLHGDWHGYAYAPGMPHQGSPPMMDTGCLCCQPQLPQLHPHYQTQPQYLEAPEPLMTTPAGMAMAIPQAAPRRRQIAGSVPPSAPHQQYLPLRPRKCVTFADPIAEVRVVPRHSSYDAGFDSASPLAPRRSERRNSVYVDSQGLASDYSTQALGSSYNMFTSSYTVYPTDSAVTEPRPATATSAYGSGQKAKNGRSDFSYDPRFSLSIAHLPLNG